MKLTPKQKVLRAVTTARCEQRHDAQGGVPAWYVFAGSGEPVVIGFSEKDEDDAWADAAKRLKR